MKSVAKVLLAALFFLAACGGQQANEQTDPQKAVEPLAIANEQLYKLSQPLALAGVPAPVLVMPFDSGVVALDTAEWDCSKVVVSGDLTDGDRDGIPVNATYNGRCTWSYSDSSGSAEGHWEFTNLKIQDPDDADPGAGVKASGQVSWGVQTGTTSVTLVWNLDRHDLVKQGATYNFDYEGSWTATVAGNTYNFKYDLSGDWTPDNASDPWGDGVINAKGSFSGSGPSCASWSATFTLSALHFQGSKIVSGSGSYTVTGCDGKTASATVTWSASRVCVTVGNNSACVPND